MIGLPHYRNRQKRRGRGGNGGNVARFVLNLDTPTYSVSTSATFVITLVRILVRIVLKKNAERSRRTPGGNVSVGAMEGNHVLVQMSWFVTTVNIYVAQMQGR
jgi:hypothetical protein